VVCGWEPSSPTSASESETGVVFWDYVHGQGYVAPNGIELHPLLSFRCLTG
jgi:hypothetical protein